MAESLLTKLALDWWRQRAASSRLYRFVSAYIDFLYTQPPRRAFMRVIHLIPLCFQRAMEGGGFIDGLCPHLDIKRAERCRCRSNHQQPQYAAGWTFDLSSRALLLIRILRPFPRLFSSSSSFVQAVAAGALRCDLFPLPKGRAAAGRRANVYTPTRIRWIASPLLLLLLHVICLVRSF